MKLWIRYFRKISTLETFETISIAEHYPANKIGMDVLLGRLNWLIFRLNEVGWLILSTLNMPK